MDNDLHKTSNLTVLKLIFMRVVGKFGYSIWESWLALFVFLFLLSGLLYLISAYECPLRRALGFPLSRSQDATGAFYYGRLWEQDCQAKP